MKISEGISDSIASYFDEVTSALRALPAADLERAIYRLDEARWKGQAVFTCGNGGSAATAIHFACDLAKGALAPRKPPIKALSLCDNISLVTAWANDACYDDIFAERLFPWVKPGDVLVAVSGSGNSPNVLNAVKLAGAVGATTIGLTGSAGGRLRGLVDLCITVPCNCMEQIEDVHLLVCHLITTCLRDLPAREAAESQLVATISATAAGE